MSYPPPYAGQYTDIYGSESPSTPHSQQPPGGFPQWETLEHAQAQDLHSLQSSHHSTPMQTPTSTSFRPIELEEPPHFVPSQAHLVHSGSPMGDAPVLLHHPLAVQQHHQYQQPQPQYAYFPPQQQQVNQIDYEPMQEMGPPATSALFHGPQQPTGVLRTVSGNRERAVAAHPYYRRTSGSSLSSHHGHDSPGGSGKSPETSVGASPAPSAGGGGVTTPTSTVGTVPPPPSVPVRATARRTRSAAKPKPSVRFEAGTKTISGPAPTASRALTTRISTPVPSASTVPKSSAPVLRSSSRKAVAPSTTRTPPSSQTGATSSSGASGSGSGSTLSSTVSQPTSSTSTSIPAPSSLLPDPPTIQGSSTSQPAATSRFSPFVPAQVQASRTSGNAPVLSIRADTHYSMRTHVLTASFEMPGVKRENLKVKLGTSYWNHIKHVTVVALNLPAFRDDDDESGEEENRNSMPEAPMQAFGSSSAGATTESSDVHMRREEEEEEDEGNDFTMKSETGAPESATSTTNPDAPQSPSSFDVPSLPPNPSTSTSSSSDSQPKASSLWDIYGPYIPPKSARQTPRHLTGTDVGVIGRAANPTVRERRYGAMRRSIRVPSTTTVENISATLEAGVLTLEIDCGEPFMLDDSVDVPVHVL